MSEELYFDFDKMNVTQEENEFINNESQEEITTETESSVEEETTTDETEETVDETTHEETPSTDTDDSSSALADMANYLKQEGVLYVDEDIAEIKSLADLKDLIAKSNEKARYSNLNDSQKRYQEALAAGIPKNEFEDIEKEIQTFESINDQSIESDENLRFEINALDLINKGIAKEKAIKLAKLSLTDESNISDTKAILKNMIEEKRAKFKSIVEESNKKTELGIEEIKKAVFDKSKILEMQLNDNTKAKLFDMMTTKVGNDDDNRPMNEFQKWQKDNPLESNIITNYLYMVTNGFKDLGVINKTSNSKATKDIEKKLRSLNFDKSGALIIPDELIRQPSDKIEGKDKNKLTINI